jgi:Skp family chaperone for outer membrane proteins
MDQTEKRQIRWYEVIYVLVLLGLLGLSVFFMNPHKVAVLDVDRVFKETGMIQKIEKDRQKLDAYVQGTRLQQAYNVRIGSLKQKYDAAKTQADKDKIQAQLKASAEQFQASIAPIQSAMQSYEANVVATFRRRLQPFVAKVAQKRRVDLVMYPGANLLYVRSTIDVTDDVIAASKTLFARDLPLVDPALNAGPSDPRR